MAAASSNRFAILAAEEDGDNCSDGTSVPQPTVRPPIMKTTVVPVAVVPNSRPTKSTKTFDLENFCGICKYHFSTKSIMQAHMKNSPAHQNYCNLCKRVFKNRSQLSNHVKQSKGHDIVCNLCFSAFKDKWGLKNHFENNYHAHHEYVCMACLLGFRSAKDLENHFKMSLKHTLCATCDKQFQNQDERDQHWRNTTDHKHCLQPGCDFDGPDDNALQQHISVAHFQCEGCKCIFPSQTKLKKHNETCPFSLNCPKCGGKFASKDRLASHLEYCYPCAKCGFHANGRAEFFTHMTDCNTNVSCWFCSKRMASIVDLVKHIESGKCPSFLDPTILLEALGKSGYAVLYMDIDVHRAIRTEQADLNGVLQTCCEQGNFHLFICRGGLCRGEEEEAWQPCLKTFAKLSDLVLHCQEDQDCPWTVERLQLEDIAKDCKEAAEQRRDSATALE